MVMRLVPIMFMLGALALLSEGAPSMADGNLGEYTREKCIKVAGKLLADIKPDTDIMARLDDARKYYNKDINPSYKVPPPPASCSPFEFKIDYLCFELPFSCWLVMGDDKYQNWLDILKANRLARFRLEAKYACKYAHKAGIKMRDDGVFNAITGKN